MMHNFNSDPFYLTRSHEFDWNGNESAGNGIQHVDSADITSLFSMHNGIKASNASGSLQFGGSLGQFEKWDDPIVADHTSNHNELAGVGLNIGGDSSGQSNERFRNQKKLVKLAQNREAARKSRMRKKAYVKELEMSQKRLLQLDQALEKARHQAAKQRHSIGRDDAFDRAHARWLGEHERLMDELRSSLLSGEGDDTTVHLLVDAAISHYGDLHGIKSKGAGSDMFHILSGTWTTPAERLLMWLGGFRSSDLLKVVEKQMQNLSLSEEQLVCIFNLQKSCQQAEDALSQGMEALQHSLTLTLSSSSLARPSSGDVVDYASHMATAMSNVHTIQSFLNQADLLRLHTLQQLQRILSPCQAARALLAINDYKARLRALSSLWLARPKE
ncbi:transcription factor TGA2-like isoform X1 [Salvia hispanica]|uniref:transcription factor TGA2-like isoform X1 n=1 Tax=Salvia hispanica TaxID=49212 RepID=UPI002009C970|nr:transcription factor TGA2-like isoform X1 [Salvia hispanica]